MNSLKVVFGGSVNGIAAAYFIWARMVYWPYVVLMAVAAIAGGYGGAGVGRKLGGRRTPHRDRHRLRHGRVAVHQEIGVPGTAVTRRGSGALPTCTVSIEIDPPSTPSTGNAMPSPRWLAPST